MSIWDMTYCGRLGNKRAGMGCVTGRPKYRKGTLGYCVGRGRELKVLQWEGMETIGEAWVIVIRREDITDTKQVFITDTAGTATCFLTGEEE